MITPDQEKWIAHLSSEELVKIVPLDETAGQKFEKVKANIQAALGEDTIVEHHGSTLLGIAGQDEIDVYIPVAPDRFAEVVLLLHSLFGEPKSLYSAIRARFVTEESGKHIDIFVINKEDSGWRNMLKFENYLLKHPKALEEYRILKEKLARQSIQEYYRRKIEFINEIIAREKN